MTALKTYERLECTGLWRLDQETQRREVVVSFGHASLVLTNIQNKPLTHWSLAAIEMHKGEAGQTILIPGEDSHETLEISDKIMLDAISQVQKAILKNHPHPGRLRKILTITFLSLLTFIGLFWAPQAIERYAVKMLPQIKRVELGQAIASQIGNIAGPFCQGPDGTTAAAQLATRLSTGEPLKFLILPGHRDNVVTLPGGIVILFETMMTQTNDPKVLVGKILSARAEKTRDDPLNRLMSGAGPLTALRLIASSELSGKQLNELAKIALSSTTVKITAEELLAEFKTMEVNSTPYAKSEFTDDDPTRLELIAQDPYPAGATRIVLEDGAWLVLQTICTDL